jgi:hypothetical protein
MIPTPMRIRPGRSSWRGKAVTPGGSLQLFTAGLHFAVTVARNGLEHVTGGLRSGVGYNGSVANHKISLCSPRQHQR